MKEEPFVPLGRFDQSINELINLIQMTLRGQRRVEMYKVKAWLYLMRKKGLEKKIRDTLPIDETGQVRHLDS
jgi:hypothetical protein